jgi:hypothetical protein
MAAENEGTGARLQRASLPAGTAGEFRAFLACGCRNRFQAQPPGSWILYRPTRRAPIDRARHPTAASGRRQTADGNNAAAVRNRFKCIIFELVFMYILRQPQVSTRCCWPLRMVGRGHKNRRRDKEPRHFHCKRSQQHPKLTVSYRARSHCCNAESRLEISKVHSPEDQNRTFGERMPGSLHRFHCLTHDSPLSGCSGAAGSAPSNSHLVFFLRGWTRHNCQANRSRRNGPSMEHPEVHVNTSEKHLQLKSTSRV